MTHPRRFRFGAEMHGPLPGLTWPETVRRIEELGYSTVFVPDHFSDQLGPIAMLTAAALSSSTLNVGSLVFDNDYRHPVVLAKEMATVDLLSEGRLELGIGAGWMQEDYDRSGIEMDRPGVRVDRMIEAVQVLRGLFGAEPVTFAGEHYRIDGLPGSPRPHTPGGPPLIIAGGSKRMLRFAGANAAIVGVNPSIHSGSIDAAAGHDGLGDRIDEKVGWVREGAGDRFDDLELNAWIAVARMTDDAVGFAEVVAPGFGVDGSQAAEALASPMVLVGTVEELSERLEQRRARWGYSYHVIRDESVEEMAPLVAAMTGR